MISDIIQTPRLLWPENDFLSCLVLDRFEISRTMSHTYVRTVDFRGKNMVTVMVPTTQMFWLQRRWFCQTVERITPEGSKSFCIVITCFPTTALVEFPNSIFWQFCSLTVFSQRVITCIATILQVGFLYSIFRPFDHKSNCFWEWSLLSLHWFCNNWSEGWM